MRTLMSNRPVRVSFMEWVDLMNEREARAVLQSEITQEQRDKVMYALAQLHEAKRSLYRYMLSEALSSPLETGAK